MGRQEEQEEYGGYSVGSVQLTANTNLVVCIGGSGASGGWNGGGKGAGAGGDGGGGTDIRIDSESLYARIIVAGGGGGGMVWQGDFNGGAGGGVNGQRCKWIWRWS